MSLVLRGAVSFHRGSEAGGGGGSWEVTSNSCILISNHTSSSSSSRPFRRTITACIGHSDVLCVCLVPFMHGHWMRMTLPCHVSMDMFVYEHSCECCEAFTVHQIQYILRTPVQTHPSVSQFVTIGKSRLLFRTASCSAWHESMSDVLEGSYCIDVSSGHFTLPVCC